MKLRCDCGAHIVDQTDYLPYKGQVFRDQNWDHVWGALRDDVIALLAATRRGDAPARARWIAERLGADFAPDARDDLIVMIYLSRLKQRYALDVYECPSCGRLLVERDPGSNSFVAFRPDGDDAAPVLRATRDVGDRSSGHGTPAV